ncbi:methylated-DNA--[protein]-cysteine S-methyltransferase [Flagellimonas taeanensis]|uniref:bifunctional helix-turn-helix domain-containing protein/methylated-DNA--[protein]-cysteine S-methyltransferase n=1 Tax=Flavobacteriaceae TaxID=49546 RepID=UPI000E6857C1|nr:MULTISPECIES: methylated-DNA--[protein]-cysteine S-methyltransferase [Allomuricauda]MDC6384714.1 methylated-DNA--[protein]-cysteine S-methyltransferase [Muricauda sp. SK9]RIV53541.1 methylated-DNA--[protein]-cysteine S-methyltransferase [Allomuricauda taeanensis]
MNTQAEFNYDRVARAITFIRSNFKEQPSLNEIAESVHLSPYHFQRLFTEWAGVSPKKFMQYISVEHAKKMLKEAQLTLSETAMETGFSGTGRLHDLFVNIEGMTPGEYKNGGENLEINYSFAESPFGKLIVASTPKGICHMSFVDDGKEGFEDLKSRFPNATYRQLLDKNQQDGLAIFRDDWSKQEQIKLHLHGTPFQLKVWETLLKIPTGSLEVYGSIAQKMERPKASRAVGTAIGKNPVAFLIPCHRVIQSTGKVGGYMWGSTRKSAIIGWEAAQMAPAE